MCSLWKNRHLTLGLKENIIIIYQKDEQIGGMVILSHQKKILISLPDTLLSEVDSLAIAQNSSRSEFIREAMRRYVDNKRYALCADALKKGYEEMADINIELAELCLEQDNIQQQSYEEKLAECE